MTAAVVAAAALWCALALEGGGVMDGSADAGRPAAAFALVLAAAATGAALALVRLWDRVAWRGPAGLAVAGAAGLAAWSGLSVVWADAPDLAWIAANRAALGACAVVLGVAAGAVLARAGMVVAVALAAASVPVMLWALAVKALPTVAGGDGDPARLSEPLGYWNALALVVALSLPGLLWVAGDPGRAAAVRVAATAWTVVPLVVLMCTLSRGGLLAAAAAAVLMLAFAPRRGAHLWALTCAAAGAALPAVHALTAAALTTDGLTAAARRDAGAGLAWRVAAGVAVAAALAAGGRRVAPRLAGPLARARRHAPRVAAVGAAAVAAAGVAALASGRVDLSGGGAVGNDPSRVTTVNPNQRLDWWAEAARGFAGAPLTGDGAGGFRLTHLREREDAGGRGELVRQPHQLTLQLLSETGAVGLALFLTLVAGAGWGAARALRADPSAAPAVAVAGAFLLHTQLDFTWDVPATAAAGLVAAGVVAGAGGRVPPGGRPARAVAPVAAALAAAVAASGLVVWAAAREVDAGFRGDPYGHAATARSLNPVSIEADVLESTVARAAGDDARALRAARRATERQPANPRAWRLLVAAAGDGAEAQAARDRVLRLDPFGPAP